MRVRHLSCATLYPLLAPAPPGGIGCHCLRELVRTHAGEVRVISAHDPEELGRYAPA